MAEHPRRKYYLIAGERSGDLHGSNLIREIRKHEPMSVFRAWGGDEMQKQGADIVVHYRELAFMGIWEVIKNLFTIRKYLEQCKKDILDTKPDVIILIDYPGFNLRIAEFAHKKCIKVIYYISPKIWAWNQKRAYKIKKYVDRMFVILPFEEEFYRSFDFSVTYVGNPLKDSIGSFKADHGFMTKHRFDERPVIAILPGSRKQEILNMLQPMTELKHHFKDYQFVVAGVSNLDRSFYSEVEKSEDIRIVFDETYDLLNIAHAAVVTSGTAVLETAIFDVPQVVCYKLSTLSYLLGKLLVKVEFISLVNLIAGKEVVRELIQYEFNRENLENELRSIIEKGPGREQQLKDYEEVREKLSGDSPSAKAASLIRNYLEKN